MTPMNIVDLPFGAHKDARDRLAAASQALRSLTEIMDKPHPRTDAVGIILANIALITTSLAEAEKTLTEAVVAYALTHPEEQEGLACPSS